MTTTQKIKKALADQWLSANDAAVAELVTAVQELVEDGDSIEDAVDAVIDGIVWGYIQHKGIGKLDGATTYAVDLNGHLHFGCGVEACPVNGGRYVLVWPEHWRNDIGDRMHTWEVRGKSAAVAAVEQALAWQ